MKCPYCEKSINTLNYKKIDAEIAPGLIQDGFYVLLCPDCDKIVNSGRE